MADTVTPVNYQPVNDEEYINKMYDKKSGRSGGTSSGVSIPSDAGNYVPGDGTRSNGRNRNGSASSGDYGAYANPSDAPYINQIYASNLESQKLALQQGYESNLSNLDYEKDLSQKETDTNLTRAYVEAAKAQKGYNEVQNAYGLTSGAMAQAKLAQGNQAQANLTTLRTAQQMVDAEIERQRSLLAKEYASAIAKAQADNDMQRAQALYEAAKAEEERLYEMQIAAGNLMASVGDYSILGKLYGLSQDQIDKLQGTGAYAPVSYEEPAVTYSSTPAPAIDIEAEYQLIKNNISASAGDQYLKSAISAGQISLADATELRDKRY